MNTLSKVAGLLLGVVMLASCTSSPTSTVSNEPWVKGNPESSVVLSEFADFQCPACKSVEPSIDAILAEFGTQIRFEYNHFPLREIHRNAVSAGIAAEAAGKQDKFWEMKTKLFEMQSDWANSSNPNELFKQYANELGLDATSYATDLEDPTLKAKVEAGRRAGEDLNVNSTPTFFLDGQRIRPSSLEDFRTLVREAVESQS